jgi:uncharacterized cupin superfamily protein
MTKLDPDCGQRFVPLGGPLGVSAFGLNQKVLDPGQRSRIHRHRHQEEVYLVVEGELTVLFDEHECTVGRGELLRVAPHLRRQLANRGPERLLLVALGGAGQHDSDDGEAFLD